MPRSVFLGPAYLKRFFALSIIATFLSGCSEPTASDRALSSRPAAIIVIDGKLLRVFNVQLRSIDDPNITDDPNNRPYGNLQLKLFQNADATFTLAWTGEISNAGRESFTGFSMTQVGIDRPALLVGLGEVDGITDRLVEPDDSGVISTELAAAMLSQPPDGSDRVGIPPDVGDFVIKFYTVERPGGALTGSF